MNRSQIGTSGISITELAFGSGPIASMPNTYGYEVDEHRARATIDAILDGPANVIDTSRNYGFGAAEERIGAAIADRGGLPDGFLISTKLDRNMDTGQFDATQARRSLEESLEALGTDHVHILHLHDPEHARDLDEIRRSGGAIDELFRMKEEGITDTVGLAMGHLDSMASLVREFPFDVILNHNRYTLLHRGANDLFQWAYEKGISVWNAAPYAGGVLAKGTAAAPRLTYQPADEDALAPVRAIEQVCAEFDVPMGAVALQFSLRDPRIATTVVGVSKPERVATTVAWAEIDISDEVWAAIRALGYSMRDPEADRDYNPG